MGGNTKEIVGLIRELPLLRGYDDKSLEALVDE